MKITDFINKAHKPIVDLEGLCCMFTTNPTKQECFKVLIDEVTNSNKPYFLSTFRRKYAKEIKYKNLTENQAKFNCMMISEVWKACFALGLFHRKRRGAEVKLSRKFVLMLNEISSYWNKYLEAKR